MSNGNIILRQLGKNGPQVPRLGLGCVPLGGGAYGVAGSDKDRLAFLDEAYAMGARFWDTGMLSPHWDRAFETGTDKAQRTNTLTQKMFWASGSPPILRSARILSSPPNLGSKASTTGTVVTSRLIHLQSTVDRPSRSRYRDLVSTTLIFTIFTALTKSRPLRRQWKLSSS